MSANAELSMKRAAILIATAGVVLGLTGSLFVLYQLAGGWGVFFGVLVFPLTFTYFPIYSLFAEGSWGLLLLNYGSVVLSWTLLSMAAQQEEEPHLASDEPPTQPVVTKETPSTSVIFIIIGGIIFIAVVCALTLRAM